MAELRCHKRAGQQSTPGRGVLVVLPERRALLSRELVCTALTPITEREARPPSYGEDARAPIRSQVARDRSVLLLSRDSSDLFRAPSTRGASSSPRRAWRGEIERSSTSSTGPPQDARNAGTLRLCLRGGARAGDRRTHASPWSLISRSGAGAGALYWERSGDARPAPIACRDSRQRVAGSRVECLEDRARYDGTTSAGVQARTSLIGFLPI